MPGYGLLPVIDGLFTTKFGEDFWRMLDWMCLPVALSPILRRRLG
jgi:hypothetical protein